LLFFGKHIKQLLVKRSWLFLPNGDNNEVQDIPSISKVRILMANKAKRDDLYNRLNSENGKK